MAAELKRLKALLVSDGEEPIEEAKPSLCTANEASTDLLQALIDATEAAELAKMQLRAVLRAEPVRLYHCVS